MSESTTAASELGEPAARLGWLAPVRLLAAWGVTAAIPLGLGISLIYYVMGPRIEPRYLALAVGGGLAVLLLTWNLGYKAAIRPWNFAIFTLLVLTWGVATAVLGYVNTNADPAMILFYAAASIWMMWLAWIGFWPLDWFTKVAVFVALAALLFVFHRFVAVVDLSGGAQLRLAWRSGIQPAVVDPLEVADAQPIAVTPSPNDFPQFLGPDRNAVLANVRLDPDWTNRPPKPVWRQRIGEGWGAFAVVGAYAFTQEQRGEEECIVCYEVRSGKPVWIHADRTRFESQFGGDGPRATPTVHDGRVYAVGATGVFNCLDAATGRRLWSHKLIDSPAENLSHGVCGSPLVVDDLVYVCPVADEKNSLAAYDRVSGELRFQAGGGRASYSSPAYHVVAGRPQILCFNDQALASHDPRTGEVLWTFAWGNTSGVNVAQPIAFVDGADLVFLSTAYGVGAALVEVGLKDGKWSIANRWKDPAKTMQNKFCSSVLVGDRFVGLDNGILAACNVATGKQLWKSGRYGHGQILLVGGLLLVLTEDPANLVLVNPARERREVAELGIVRNVLNGKTWNNLAFSPPYLLIRNSTEAACYQLACIGEEFPSAFEPSLEPAESPAPSAPPAADSPAVPPIEAPAIPEVAAPPAAAPGPPDDPLPALPLPPTP